jgi:NADPH-dependent 2,4-dienoyl-CoA reductase/sulfur reductase-like enzyme
MAPIVIVGASLAGLSAAKSVRAAGHDGSVVVLDPAPGLPADRPPLSKQVLAGSMEPARAHQPLANRLADLDLDLRFGVAATGLDTATRTLTLSDGSELTADGIVLAMGAAARRLPGPRLDGVHVVRDLADCLALRADLDAGPDRVAVIGAGFIGAEVAATCREMGHEVTIIEAAPVPMARAFPGTIGNFVADLHRDHGVEVRLGVGVDSLTDDGSGRVTGVRLADGTEVSAGVVVVGIGVTLNVDWLQGSGLDLSDGVVCDETCLAAPGITAAGDVASWFNAHYGERMRVEHWEHAIEQGEAAGLRLVGGDAEAVPFLSVPWFWSDMYDRKIQMAGRPSGGDELVVLDGSIEERRFVAAFRRGDRCTAVMAVNRPRHAIQARMKLAESLDWDPIAEMFS